MASARWICVVWVWLIRAFRASQRSWLEYDIFILMFVNADKALMALQRPSNFPKTNQSRFHIINNLSGYPHQLLNVYGLETHWIFHLMVGLGIAATTKCLCGMIF
jgi:hypothetical protein